MTLEEFEDHLDTFGSALGTWPDDLATAARALLENSADARAELALARELDEGLDALMAQPVSAPSGLADRIAVKAGATSPHATILAFPVRQLRVPEEASVARKRSRFWPPERGAAIAAAMMAACFIGGVIAVQAFSPADDRSEIIYMAAVYNDLAW